jgi:hypothetical protein
MFSLAGFEPGSSIPEAGAMSAAPCLRGVYVMITIFFDFRQFSAKKLAFFPKTIVVMKILHNLALF